MSDASGSATVSVVTCVEFSATLGAIEPADSTGASLTLETLIDSVWRVVLPSTVAPTTRS